MLDFASELRDILQEMKSERPLVHHMTNQVVVTAVADATAALGASPVVARSSVEAYDMVQHASALVLNMGTPDSDSALAMIEAGEEAGRIGVPVLLDPVGVGSTEYRDTLADDLLRRVTVDVIRANGGEIAALLGDEDSVLGVDGRISDEEYIRRAAVALSRRTGAVVAATGRRDWITDGDRSLCVQGGHTLMGRSVGTGCLSSAVVGCLLAVAGPFVASSVGLQLFSVAADRAAAFDPGPASLRIRLIDELYRISENEGDDVGSVDFPSAIEEES